MVVKPNVNKIADLKGKTVAASAPGTAPYFTLAWMLKKNGLSVKDVKVVNLEPQAAANAMIAGTDGIDAAMTYEPYLGAVRAKPAAGTIIATTLEYPMVMDTFGCTPKFLADNPKTAKALADAYFDAVAMIKAEPKKSFEIMGTDVKQSGEAFEKSRYLCAGKIATPTRSSSPASMHSSARKPLICCSRWASSSGARSVEAGRYALPEISRSS
jgi:NitT/TauT family transport system substrate-binding protein